MLDGDGRPSFSRLQHRMHVTSGTAVKRAAAAHPASLVLFDLLHCDGSSLLGRPYEHRRAALESSVPAGPRWAVTPAFPDDTGAEALRIAGELGMEGIVAKRRASPYRPGARSRDWVKVKRQRTQEVVVGGWTAGQGSRQAHFGSLLLGLPAGGSTRTLRYAGRVGTGFSQAAMASLLGELAPLVRRTSPFTEDLRREVGTAVTWVRPVLVGEVSFTEWTPDGRLRHPVWRGVRTDKAAEDVSVEP